MPTDLPPDYKPQPIPAPSPGTPASPAAPGDDAVDPVGNPGAGGVGGTGPSGDVVDPPGWSEPQTGPGNNPFGVPTPAGTPSF